MTGAGTDLQKLEMKKKQDFGTLKSVEKRKRNGGRLKKMVSGGKQGKGRLGPRGLLGVIKQKGGGLKDSKSFKNRRVKLHLIKRGGMPR